MDVPKNKDVILFDGHCNLCNKTVQFILNQDRIGRFLFASLQGRAGKEFLSRFGMLDAPRKSILLIQKDIVYSQSSAALRIARGLPGAWKLLYGFMIIPAPIRNGVYHYIAENRYKWFGRRESCWLPTDALRSRFLD